MVVSGGSRNEQSVEGHDNNLEPRVDGQFLYKNASDHYVQYGKPQSGASTRTGKWIDKIFFKMKNS